MAGNKAGSDGLLFQQEFRFFGFYQDQFLFVVIFFQLILRTDINKYPGCHSLSCIATIFDGEVGLVSLTVFSFHDIHNTAFRRVRK